MKKTFEILITTEAEKDFLSIWNYISEDSPATALSFLEQIEEKIFSLESNPERCAFIPENRYYQGAAYRHLIYKDYRIVFGIKGKTIIVHRVFHGSQLLDIAFLENL